MKVLNEAELKREAERLLRTGRMPTLELEELCAAVLEARKKYANQIRRARREAREKIAGSGKVQ